MHVNDSFAGDGRVMWQGDRRAQETTKITNNNIHYDFRVLLKQF